MLDVIYSPGSVMDDKRIENRKAGNADSLSRGNVNNKCLIIWEEKRKFLKD